MYWRRQALSSKYEHTRIPKKSTLYKPRYLMPVCIFKWWWSCYSWAENGFKKVGVRILLFSKPRNSTENYGNLSNFKRCKSYVTGNTTNPGTGNLKKCFPLKKNIPIFLCSLLKSGYSLVKNTNFYLKIGEKTLHT